MNVAKFLVRDYELRTNTRLTDLRRHINGFIGGGDAQSKPANAHKNRALDTLTQLKIMCASTNPDHRQAAANIRRHLGLTTSLPCEGDESTSWEAIEAELMASDLKVRGPAEEPVTFEVEDPDSDETGDPDSDETGDPEPDDSGLANDITRRVADSLQSLDVEDRRKKIQVLNFALQMYKVGRAMKRDPAQRDVGFAALWGSIKRYLPEPIQAKIEENTYAASIVLRSVQNALRNL